MIEDTNLDKIQKALRIAYELEQHYQKIGNDLHIAFTFYGVINGAEFEIFDDKEGGIIKSQRYYYDTTIIGQTMNDLIADVAREYRRATGKQYDVEKKYANNEYQGKEEMK